MLAELYDQLQTNQHTKRAKPYLVRYISPRGNSGRPLQQYISRLTREASH